MAVHKKHPADAKAMADKEEKEIEKKLGEVKKEPMVLSDIVTKTTERIEIVEETDPLTGFKEKMAEEESILGESQNKNYMWPILFIFIIVILLLIGIFLYKSGGVNIEDKINVAVLSPTPTIVPEPTKTVDLAQYEIEIQNGSGISGEASRQKINLEEEGFTVSSIGNADNSDYEDTIIKAKKEVEKAFLNKLKNIFESSFIVKEEILPDTASVPVVVIIGSKN